MTPHTTVTPAAVLCTVAQPNDKYNNNNPNLISFLMNHAAMQQQQSKQQQFHEQQKSYVSALVGKFSLLYLSFPFLSLIRLPLTDVTVQVIASIWPNSISSPNNNNNSTTNNTTTKPIADLNTFLHHILKHSRTTHSTLQLAIFYLFRIRSRVQEKKDQDVYISCGRRMFLAALISAHKYLQDKTYKNSAWSKVSGLNVNEINHAEKVMLQLLDYRLYVKKDTYDQWILMLQTHLKVVNPVGPGGATTSVPMMATPTTTTPTAALLNQQKVQEKLLQLRKAQQSLPSPPLEDSWMSPTTSTPSSKKRKNSISSINSDQQLEQDRATKRRC